MFIVIQTHPIVIVGFSFGQRLLMLYDKWTSTSYFCILVPWWHYLPTNFSVDVRLAKDRCNPCDQYWESICWEWSIVQLKLWPGVEDDPIIDGLLPLLEGVFINPADSLLKKFWFEKSGYSEYFLTWRETEMASLRTHDWASRWWKWCCICGVQGLHCLHTI